MATEMKGVRFWEINAVGVDGTKGDCQNKRMIKTTKIQVISASDVVKSNHDFDLWRHSPS